MYYFITVKKIFFLLLSSFIYVLLVTLCSHRLIFGFFSNLMSQGVSPVCMLKRIECSSAEDQVDGYDSTLSPTNRSNSITKGGLRRSISRSTSKIRDKTGKGHSRTASFSRLIAGGEKETHEDHRCNPEGLAAPRDKYSIFNCLKIVMTQLDSSASSIQLNLCVESILTWISYYGATNPKYICLAAQSEFVKHVYQTKSRKTLIKF